MYMYIVKHQDNDISIWDINRLFIVWFLSSAFQTELGGQGQSQIFYFFFLNMHSYMWGFCEQIFDYFIGYF